MHSPSNQTLKVIYITLLIFLLVSCFFYFRGFKVISSFDVLGGITSAAKDLAQYGTWNSSYYYEAYNKICESAKDSNHVFWQDVFALGADGSFYPKHSPFSIFIGAIFFLTFGDLGFWICQQIVVLTLVLSLYFLSKKLNPNLSILVFFLSLIVGCFNLFHGHSYLFSYELHFSMLTVLACALFGRFSLIAGVVCGLALFIRPTAILFLPAVLVARGKINYKSDMPKFLIGFLSSLIAFGAMNWSWFGDPFTTAYQRLYNIAPNGSLIPSDHPLSPTLKSFFSNMSHKFFDWEDGIFAYNLSLLAFFYIAAKLRRIKPIYPELVLAIASFLPVIYFMSYNFNEGVNASRFYMTSALLCVPLLSRYISSVGNTK